MRAGRIRTRLTLRRPTTTTTETGSTVVGWEDATRIWAERVKMSGNPVTESGEQFSYYRADFNIREAHEVAEKWQVQEEGGYLYIVTNIIPNVPKGYKTLQCARYNE